MELLGYFTERGRELSAKLLTGAALRVTRVAAGDGETPLSASAMAAERQQPAVSAMRREGTTVTLPVTLTAAQAQTDYTLREVGVYALDGEEELLYRLYRLDEPITISAGDRLTVRMELQETVSEASEVTVSGTSAGLLTEADLELRVGQPNGIAALDAGGRVPVSQLPALDYAPAYSYGTEDLTAGTSALTTGKLYFVYE